jgi:nitrogen fixation NifU-like protein
MSDLRDLYQEVILDHNRRPRNFGELPGADRRADGYNPLCGDRVTVHLALEGDRLKDIRFQGSGCAISTASASLMTDHLKGKTRAEVERLFAGFHGLVTGKAGPGDQGLGKLAAFSGVSEFPARVKCATLVWHTLKAALENRPEPVSTEH